MSALNKTASSPGNNGELSGVLSCLPEMPTGVRRRRHPFKLSRREIETSLKSCIRRGKVSAKA